MPLNTERPEIRIFRFFDSHGNGRRIPVGNDVRPLDECGVAGVVQNLLAADVHERVVVFDPVQVEMVKIPGVFPIVDVRRAFYVLRDAPGLRYCANEGGLSGSQIAVQVCPVAGKELRHGGEFFEFCRFFDDHVRNIRAFKASVNPLFCVSCRNVLSFRRSFTFFP